MSVPVLVPTDGPAMDDSTRIARWANAHGEGSDLFPQEHAQEIDRWADLSERSLAAGRGLALRRMVMDNLVSWLILYLLLFVINGLGMIPCFLGLFVTVPFSALVLTDAHARQLNRA